MRPAVGGRASTAIEDYLKSIYVLGERSPDPVTTSLVAERMGVAVSSASGMVRKMRELGLVQHARYGDIALTGAGQQLALGVLRRHRLIEQFLVTEFGYSWDEVHTEAEALEHVVSDRLVEAIAERLGHPKTDPHGDPIPGRGGELEPGPAQRLSSLPLGETGDLVRVDDDPAVLRHLTSHTVTLGDRIGLVRREPFGGAFVVRIGHAPDERELRFGPDLVDALWVRVQN